MKKILLIFVPFLLLACIAFVLHNGYFEKGVAIDDDTFPDAKFREYVEKHYDTNGNGYLGEFEREKVTSISMESCFNVQGIDTFPNIVRLDLSYVDDVSAVEQLSKLSELKLTDCSSVNLDFSKLTGLKTVNIKNCVIENEINMTGLEYLEKIELVDSKFDKMAVEDCPSFQRMTSHSSSAVNDMSFVNLPKFNYFSSNKDEKLEGLHFIDCPKLLEINVGSASELSEMELKGCTVLENLDLPKCKITEVDLRECPRLVEAVNDERTFTEESKILKDKDTGRMKFHFDTKDFYYQSIYYFGDVNFITK